MYKLTLSHTLLNLIHQSHHSETFPICILLLFKIKLSAKRPCYYEVKTRSQLILEHVQG